MTFRISVNSLLLDLTYCYTYSFVGTTPCLVRYCLNRYQTQSDIVHDGCRTECPPMSMIQVLTTKREQVTSLTCTWQGGRSELPWADPVPEPAGPRRPIQGKSLYSTHRFCKQRWKTMTFANIFNKKNNVPVPVRRGERCRSSAHLVDNSSSQ